MSISDNNFNLPSIPPGEEENTPESKITSGELSGHSISQTGEENPQISEAGEKIVQDIGDENSSPHHLPPGISISTSGGEHAQKLAESIINFSTESPLSANLSRSSSTESLNSLQSNTLESMSLSDISTNQQGSSPRSISRSSSFSNVNSSKLEDNISPLPKYDPKDKASIQNFLRDPRVLANMKEKGGHYIYPDASRSSFIFIPNGDFSKAKSIVVTNGRTKENITNPADFEMCIAKYAVIYNEAETDWNTRGATKIRQDLGLPLDAPVNIKHFTLNLKFKQAIGYGEFNSKEASPGYTPSAWRRGSKIKVSSSVWDDVGGLNSVDLSKRRPTEEDNSSVNFSTETPEHFSKTESPQPTSPTPSQQPVVININVAGGQGGQGGSSNSNTNTPDQTNRNNESIPINQQTSTNQFNNKDSTSKIEETPIGYEEDGQRINDNLEENNSTESNIRANQENITTPSSNDLNNLLEKIRKHLNSVYDSNGIYVGSQDRQIRDIIHEHENGKTSNENDNLIEAPLGENVKLTPIEAKMEFVPGNLLNQRISNNENEETNLPKILAAVRNHLDEVFSPNGEAQINGIGNVIKEVENSSSSKIPSLAIPEDQSSSNDLVSAARTTTSALQDLLSSITPKSNEEKEEPNDSSSRIPSLSLPEDQSSNDDLVSAARTTTSALQNLLSSINFTSQQEKELFDDSSSKIPSLSLPEDQSSSDDLVSAARTTTSALQNLLSSITPNSPENNIPNPETESRDLKQILQKVRKHVEQVYSPQGKARIGGIAQVIKSEENKNS